MGTDGANLITQSLSVDKLVDLLATTVDDMTAQLYFKSLKYIFNESKKKKNLDPDTCIMMIDFADNYQYVLQDSLE